MCEFVYLVVPVVENDRELLVTLRDTHTHTHTHKCYSANVVTVQFCVCLFVCM